MKNLVIAALAGFFVFASTSAPEAQVVFDGKKGAFHSTAPGGIALPGPLPGPVLVATIAKGKKKSVITVDATITSEAFAPFAPWTLSMGVDINGTPMEPSTTFPFNIVQDCGSSAAIGPHAGIAEGCTVSGTFLLDMDAPANAGLLNVPLIITLTGGEATNPFIGGIPVSATMVARMEKKK